MARFPLSWLMALVAIIALGLAAMRNGSRWACSVMMGTMVLGLCVATLGAVVRPSPASSWRGFTVFAWIYVGSTFLLPEFGWGDRSPSPFGIAVLSVADRLHSDPKPPPKPTNPAVLNVLLDRDGAPITGPRPRPPGQPVEPDPYLAGHVEEARRYHFARLAHMDAVMARGRALENAARIGHASMAFAFGLLGAFAGQALSPVPRGPSPSPPPPSPAASPLDVG
jgi:hypothetical protein